jgi:hypothetical protein
VNPAWLPTVDGFGRPFTMRRIIVHWTAGGPNPSALDIRSYHLLINSAGAVSRGFHPISANATDRPLTPGVYAAHVASLNGGSIGVSMCGMGGAASSSQLGPHPLMQAQWDVAVRVCAQLCQVYRIVPGRKTVLGHSEVGPELGVPQAGKWDPWVCTPGIRQTADVRTGDWAEWAVGSRTIGDRFRAEVAAVAASSAPVAVIR